MPPRRALAESRSPLWFAIQRIKTALSPNVTITPAPPSILAQWDVPITMRDGVTLRANVFRPKSDERVPVIMSAHPYGKDKIAARTRSGRSPNLQYRLFPQPDPIAISDWTGWEAPDPAVLVQRGYAVINCDLRGAGTSEGVGEFFSEIEGRDYYDLIEWAAAQAWSNGRVGLDGVSYLAISQYFAAVQHPAHLAAICPWEGFNDVYWDFVYPGGVRENGFSKLWFRKAGQARVKTTLEIEANRHTNRDAFWAERAAPIEKIEAPMLVCGSFSDHSLHTRGGFEAYRRAASGQKWMYTHRSGKWCTYYGQDATETRLRFFDHFLKGDDNGWDREPAVRLAIYDTGSQAAAVTKEEAWPPNDLAWRRLWLGAKDMALADASGEPATVSFDMRGKGIRFSWTVTEDIDVIGPMALRLPIELRGVDDMNLFAGIRKFRRGQEILFEGSFGFRRDIVSKGWQRAAHRELDAALATPSQPVHTHSRAEPLKPSEILALEIELRQHATRFLKGDVLCLELRGTWFFARNPLSGQFPASYEPSLKGTCVVHTGGSNEAFLYFGSRPSAATDAKLAR